MIDKLKELDNETLLEKIRMLHNERSFYYFSEVEYHHKYANYDAATKKLEFLLAEAERRGLKA